MAEKKPKIPRLSFKRRPRSTGLAAVGEKDSWDIKVDKKVCGSVSLESLFTASPDRAYQISFAVKNGETFFKWILLKQKFPGSDGGELAMKYLKENWEAVYSRLFADGGTYSLHFFSE